MSQDQSDRMQYPNSGTQWQGSPIKGLYTESTFDIDLSKHAQNQDELTGQPRRQLAHNQGDFSRHQQQKGADPLLPSQQRINQYDANYQNDLEDGKEDLPLSHYRQLLQDARQDEGIPAYEAPR